MQSIPNRERMPRLYGEFNIRAPHQSVKRFAKNIF